MTTEPIKIGIVGAGKNTRDRHIPGLQAVDGVEIVSVCNRSRESSQRVADAFGIPTIYEDWRELMAAGDTNAIMIGTWPYMHREMTCTALEAGKHVMCEARMAMNAAEAHAMLATSKEHPELVAQIVPSPLTFKVDRTIKQLLDEGYVGDLNIVKVVGAVPGFADPGGPLHWRHQKVLSGFNILNMGIWYEASMRWVGPAASVSARTRICVGRRRDDESGAIVEVDVPDHVEIIADLESGALATYTFSAVTGLAPGPGAWIFGTAGTLHYDHANGKLFGGKVGEGALQEIPIVPENAGSWRVEEEFAGAIRGQEKIRLTDFATGVRYMEFTEAVSRSATSDEAETLPLSGL